MNDPAVTALAEAAQTLQAQARQHKRAEAEHRRKARALQRKLEQIRCECDRLGIDLQITQATPKGRSSQ
jgi:hypothetical protein